MLKNVRYYLVALTAAIVAVCATSVSPVIADESQSPYSVDFTRQTGKIKPLNGVNLWAKTQSARINDLDELARACRFSTIRLHDVPLDNAGMRLVDVQHIFGNIDADPADPKNYCFAPTDDYIERIVNGGATTVYRLGTSIEHSKKNYYAFRPADPEKYAEICAGIVRHFNAGWANGHNWNLPYWEIWNEPDLVPNMWDSTDWNDYCNFYVVVAKRLRAEFPNIKIGGPAITYAAIDKIKSLAELCKKEGAPLDFVSWHCYAKSPSEVLDPPQAVRDALDAAGFPDCELHLNEWHYFPAQWSEMHGTDGGAERKKYWNEAPEGLHGYVSAAFNDYVLTRWQDTPLTMSNYYAFGLTGWGFFDVYGKIRTTYYSFRLFGELIGDAPNRVATTDGGGSVALLGGVDENGNVKRLLISIYKKTDDAPIVVRLTGVPESGTVAVSTIDAENDCAETQVEYSNGVLTLGSKDSGVYLIRF